MAKAKQSKENTMSRTAVSATGIQLLALIADSANGSLALTQAEGEAIVTAGQAYIVDTNDDGTANVALTELGKSMLAATPERKRAVVTVGEVEKGIARPVRVRKTPVFAGERSTKYPFETLEIDESFHVPANEANPHPMSAVSSAIVVARKKFSEPVTYEDGSPVMETVTTKEYLKDASGKFAKDVDGRRIVASSKTETRQAVRATRNFEAFAVDETDPKGPGVRVFRNQ